MFFKAVFDDKASGAGKNASADTYTKRFYRWKDRDYVALWGEFLARAAPQERGLRKQKKAADKLRKAGGALSSREGNCVGEGRLLQQGAGSPVVEGDGRRVTRGGRQTEGAAPGPGGGGVKPNVHYASREIPALKLTPEKISKSLDEFTLGTACGFSALRLEHLLQCREADTTGQFLVVLADLCQLLAEGRVGLDIQPFLGGASLSALVKKCGGIRPVAVGEIIRRLVSKALLNEVRDAIAPVLGPQQFGVGAKGGSQRVGHLMRRLWQRRNGDPNFCVWKGEFSNAFNAGKRQKILEAVKAYSKMLPTCTGCQ